MKDACPGMAVMTDVCLDEYTSHGHCGVIRDGDVDNDATLPLLARVAVSHARAGADVVAPSDMMDGRVAAIRRELDAGGFPGVAILAYAAKAASAFYGPFREAADSAPKFGDRRELPDGRREPPRGACARSRSTSRRAPTPSWSSPPSPTSTSIREARERFDLPDRRLQRVGRVRDGQGRRGQRLDRREAHRPRDLTSIVRAGADFVLTYHAGDAARWLKEGA